MLQGNLSSETSNQNYYHTSALSERMGMAQGAFPYRIQSSNSNSTTAHPGTSGSYAYKVSQSYANHPLQRFAGMAPTTDSNTVAETQSVSTAPATAYFSSNTLFPTSRTDIRSPNNPYFNINMGSKLFVGQIPAVCTEEQLRPLFAEYGNLLEVKIMREHSGRSKGSAWVRYETEMMAQCAIEALHGKWVIPPQTNTLRVQFASPSKKVGDARAPAPLPAQVYTDVTPLASTSYSIPSYSAQFYTGTSPLSVNHPRQHLSQSCQPPPPVPHTVYSESMTTSQPAYPTTSAALPAIASVTNPSRTSVVYAHMAAPSRPAVAGYAYTTATATMMMQHIKSYSSPS